MAYPNALFSTSALIGFLLCIISCPWHLTSWNTGACLYAFWTGLACLNSFINSVVWNHNFVNKAPVWCDISSKLTIGISIGIPTASFCICRRLYIISSLKSFTISKAETRRSILVDSLIGLGIPTLIMSLHYIVQGHRFNIYEDVGCGPSTYFTWQAYLVISTPPIAIGLISAVYAVVNIKQFHRMRNRLKNERPENGITISMYARFVCLSTIEVLCTVPFALFMLVYTATVLNYRFPWISWADTHYNFSRVGLVPASVWRGSKWELSLELNRWLNVICAAIFFAFFGYTDETKRTYRCVLGAFARRIGFRSAPKPYQLPPLHFKSPENTFQGSLDSLTDVNFSDHSLGIYVDEKKELDQNTNSTTCLSIHDTVQIPHLLPISRESNPATEISCLRESSHNRGPSSNIIPVPQSVHTRPRSAIETIDPTTSRSSDHMV